MIKSVKQAGQVFRKKKLSEFIELSLRYTVWLIYRIRGYRKLSCGGIQYNFSSKRRRGLWKIENLHRQENSELERILAELKEKDTFFDIGANVGLYSCFAAKKCKSVVAVEPYPPNIKVLEENIKRGKCNNISIINKGFSNESKDIRLDVPKKHKPGWGTAQIREGKGDLKVKVIPGDVLIKENKIPRPDVMKIDVEGAEPLVLDGLSNTLSKNECRYIQCEVHPEKMKEYGYTLSDLENLIHQIGYDIVKKEGKIWILRPDH